MSAPHSPSLAGPLTSFRSRTALASLLAAASMFTFVGIAPAADEAPAPYSPYADSPYPSRVLWGDTHLHTTMSFDARTFGVQLDAEAAYRFARGEEVISSTGQKVRLRSPLDFLVVTDHSDAMGSVDELIRGNPTLLKDPELSAAREKLLKGGQEAIDAFVAVASFLFGDGDSPMLSEEIQTTVWQRYVTTADRYNEPGRFTAMIGYEWTPTTGGNKLHRNVLYRGDADVARQLLPFTASESINPQDLWKWMQKYEDRTGSQVLALAHNGNLSNGQMFPVETNPNTGAAIDADYVETRARWEPLYEVTQIKGDGEAHPKLSPEDEFADFETWDRGNVSLETRKTDDMLQYEYAREALKNGLALERKLGTNPYRFGMVGSTDSHTALATAEEDNFFGKFSTVEPNPTRANEPMVRLANRDMWQIWETGASGYAAVWATENTRSAIFDAMKRREVYATSGPRMTVRFFGGFDFDEEDASASDLARRGYEAGVPMGGTLDGNDRKWRKAPRFLVAAMKDPVSGNLDRVQIVKGWLDKKGRTHEKVYDVVWSDPAGRKPGRDGKIAPVGSTVDVENASWTNTIGAAQLTGYFEDPDFDPKQPSFYYARVLEIPTPRWTAYDAKFFGTDLAEQIPTVLQERAYTSPIWYEPK